MIVMIVIKKIKSKVIELFNLLVRSDNEPRIINGKMTLYELERPQKEKESEIYEMFASEIEAYYDKKTS